MNRIGRRLGAAAACAAALGLCAFQAAPVPANTLTLAQVRSLIDAGEARSVFVAEEQGPAGAVARHTPSGLVCRFSPRSSDNVIVVYPTGPLGGRPGDDVSCATGEGGRVSTLYASRYARAPDLRGLMAASVASIRQRFPDARPFEGPVMTATAGASGRRTPEPAVAAFIVNVQGRSHYTQVSMARVGDWIVKQRLTAPVGEPDAKGVRPGVIEAQLSGSLAMTAALAEVQDAASRQET